MPEQVYNPDYDVWVLPDDSGAGDNSGSTQTNAQGLVDSLKSSDNEMRSPSWWNNFMQKFIRFFNPNAYHSIDYAVKNRESMYDSTVNDVFNRLGLSESDINSSNSSNQSEPDPTDPESWFNMLDSFYKRYQQDSLSNAQRVERFEQEEAQKLRDWQEYMSSTAYQRAIKDLKEAGINPLLALSSFSPASTPSGAMASGQYSSLVNPGYSSLASSYSSILGQNKNLGSSLANILIRLLSLFMLA